MQVNGHSAVASNKKTVNVHRDEDCETAFQFTSKLTAVMFAKNITRGRIAKDLDINIANIDAWCYGSRIPQPVNMDKLTSYLKCEVKQIFPKLEQEKKMKKLSTQDKAVTVMDNKKVKTKEVSNTDNALIKATKSFNSVKKSADKMSKAIEEIKGKVIEPVKPKVEKKVELVSPTEASALIDKILDKAKKEIAYLLSVGVEDITIAMEAKFTAKR